jgi:hypothetical protein
MTKQHKATPDDWAQQEEWANRSVFSDSSCIIELRDRIEALEAAQQPQQDKLDRLIALDRDAPAGSLVDRIATDAELCQVYDAPEHGFGPALRAVVERVADAIQHADGDGNAPAWEPEARAAILAVAAALIDWWNSHEDAPMAWEAAKWLEQEANR